MSFFLLYPAVAFLAMFVVLVMMLMLKYGQTLMNLCQRTDNVPEDQEEFEGKSYDQPVSYA
ncbi:unnamed protein product [Diamesa serratosioi]